MQDDTTTTGSGRRRIGMAGGLLAAGAVAGGVLAGTLSASAAGSADAAAYSYTAPQQSGEGSQPGGPGGPQGDRHGSAPVRGDEQALSAADAAKVKAAALKAVPGGTVYRVESDAGDAEYEAHMTKADGTEVTVKLDKNFAVTAVEDGMGKGDPAPSGGPGGAGGPSGTQPGAPTGGESADSTGLTSSSTVDAV